MAGQSIAGALGYVTGLLKLRPKSDGFFVSMRDSIAAFYRGIERGMLRWMAISGRPWCGPAFGSQPMFRSRTCGR